MRLSEALQVMYGQGEFGLSREATNIRSTQDVAGLVVGTYVVSPVRVYINARLIDPASSIVISSGSVEIKKTPEIEKLLRGSTLPPSLERIPVKHLGYKTNPYPYYLPHFPREQFHSEPFHYNPEELYGPEPEHKHHEVPKPKLENSKHAPKPILDSST